MVSAKQQAILNDLLRLAEQERNKGNASVTPDKLEGLRSYLDTTPLPKYPPLQARFQLTRKEAKSAPKPLPPRKFSLKRLEAIVVDILEVLANVLDNLHLFSKFPMFPRKLLSLLKQTNKIWIVILLFLIRKTLGQLLNVRRKEHKVRLEMEIVRSSTKGLVNSDVVRKYTKVLKDLRFDKMMLWIELVGNILDMSFNVIEFTEWAVPDWFMGTLNATSMFMTIYRMNKDDEYIDDDITEDLI